MAENPATAELIRQTLAEAGIPCLIKNTDALGVTYAAALTGAFAMQVFVLEGDEEAALVALGGREPESLPPPRLPRLRRYRRHQRRGHDDEPSQ